MSEKLRDQVYRLHCQGHEVSKIAVKLGLHVYEVRGYIVERWQLDDFEGHMLRKVGSGFRR